MVSNVLLLTLHINMLGINSCIGFECTSTIETVIKSLLILGTENYMAVQLDIVGYGAWRNSVSTSAQKFWIGPYWLPIVLKYHYFTICRRGTTQWSGKECRFFKIPNTSRRYTVFSFRRTLNSSWFVLPFCYRLQLASKNHNQLSSHGDKISRQAAYYLEHIHGG